MFHVSKPSTSLTDRVGSAVALAVMLATWAVAYVAICPADLAPARHAAIDFVEVVR